MVEFKGLKGWAPRPCANEAADEWEVIIPDGDHDPWYVAQVFDNVNDATAEQVAHLIAAAPALLEALKSAALNLDACAVAIKKGGKSDGRHILAEGWAERARAAIASALGEG